MFLQYIFIFSNRGTKVVWMLWLGTQVALFWFLDPMIQVYDTQVALCVDDYLIADCVISNKSWSKINGDLKYAHSRGYLGWYFFWTVELFLCLNLLFFSKGQIIIQLIYNLLCLLEALV